MKAKNRDEYTDHLGRVHRKSPSPSNQHLSHSRKRKHSSSHSRSSSASSRSLSLSSNHRSKSLSRSRSESGRSQSARSRSLSISSMTSRSRSRSRSYKRKYRSPRRDYRRKKSYSPRRPRHESPPQKSTIKTPTKTPGLLTYKAFLFGQADDVTAEIAQRKYTRYQEKYHEKNKKPFFERNKRGQWLRELYHPGHPYYKYIQKNKIKLLKENYESFKDRYSLNENPQFPMIKIEEANDSEEDQETAHDGKKKQKKKGTIVDNCIIITNIPQNCSRVVLQKEFQKINGFQKLFLSEPNPTKEFQRKGYLFYDTQDRCKEALDRFRDVRIPLVIKKKKKDHHVADVFVPRLRANRRQLYHFIDQSYMEDFERVSEDVEQSTKLAKILDTEKGFKNTFIYDQPNGDASQDKYQPIKHFHWILCYLRRVHLYSYYRHKQYTSEEKLFNQDIMIELGPSVGWQIAVDDAVSKRIAKANEAKEKNSSKEKMKEKDDKIEEHPTMVKYMEEFDEKNIVKKAKNKFKCNFCPKLFVSPNFVQKHIKNKHPDKITEVKNQAENEIYWQNYKADPERPREAAVARIISPDNGLNRSHWNGTRSGQSQWKKEDQHNPRQSNHNGRENESRRRSRESSYRRDSYSNGYEMNSRMRRTSLQRRMISYADVDAPELPEKELNLDYGFGPLKEKPKERNLNKEFN